MKRNERTMFNGMKKNFSVDTVYVECPVSFSTEAKDEYRLFLLSHKFVALRVNWSPIENGYTILFAPAKTEEQNETRKNQIMMEYSEFENTLRVSDYWWNGFKKPAEQTEEETEETTEPAEQTEAEQVDEMSEHVEKSMKSWNELAEEVKPNLCTVAKFNSDIDCISDEHANITFEQATRIVENETFAGFNGYDHIIWLWNYGGNVYYKQVFPFIGEENDWTEF